MLEDRLEEEASSFAMKTPEEMNRHSTGFQIIITEIIIIIIRKPSMPNSRLITFSSRSQWKHWVPTMSLLTFLDDLGRRISFLSGDDREHLFLFQRISVAIQRFNAILCMTIFPLGTTWTIFTLQTSSYFS